MYSQVKSKVNSYLLPDEELEESVVFPSLLIVVEFKLEFLLQVRSTNL